MITVCWPPQGGQPAPKFAMFILYLDESGTDAESRHFALAGIAVFERETYFLSQQMDDIAREFFADASESIEFHSSSLMAQQRRLRPPYDSLDFGDRLRLRNRIIDVIVNSKATAFGVVVEKQALDEVPYEYALEQLLSRFDRMLNRLYQAGQQERGVIVAAESSYRENVNALDKRFWNRGHRWGDLKNIADVPFFAHAKSSRLLQLADFAVNAMYRRYEEGDARQFDRIAPRIDSEGGQLHGLVHHTKEPWNCFCPACMSRRFHRPTRTSTDQSSIGESSEMYNPERC